MSWNKLSKYSLLAGIALAITSMLLRYCAFTQTAFANGWDSYYYLVQLKSIEETGQMHSPEGSLIYPFFRLFYWITSDYVDAIKWGTALLCGCWTFLLYCFPRSWKMGLLLACWSVFSPHLSYFAAEYPKNLLGLMLFLALVLSLEKARKHKIVLVSGLLVLNYFGHRMSFGLSLNYLLLYLIFQWRKPVSQAFGRPKYLFFAMFAALLLLVAAWKVPGLAQVADFQRLEGTFSIVPQFAPWSFITSFGEGKISNFWLLEIGLALFFLVIQAIQVFQMASKRQPMGFQKPALFLICLLLLFPFLKWSYLGLSWRFFLVFVLLAPLLFQDNKFYKWYWSGMLLLVFSAFFSWRTYNPALHDPNYALFSRISKNAIKHLTNGPKPDLFITHNALAEYFTFSTGIDAMPWLPEYAIDSTRLWRIATGIRAETLRYYAGQAHRASVQDIGGGYMLLPEYVWQQACEQALAEGDQVFLAAASSWYNPYQMRPSWLLQKKLQ